MLTVVAESWAGLLRDCARRGARAQVLAVGGGALGFWNGLREVFPDTVEQRCWVDETANMPDALPKSAQPAAKKALSAIWGAEGKDHAQAAIRAFEKLYGAKFPKAVRKSRWRAVNAPHLLALVLAGAWFERGILVEGHRAAA